MKDVLESEYVGIRDGLMDDTHRYIMIRVSPQWLRNAADDMERLMQGIDAPGANVIIPLSGIIDWPADARNKVSVHLEWTRETPDNNA